MKAGVLLTLVISSFLIQMICGQDFYGHSVTFSPLHRKADGSISLSLESRENGRSGCTGQVSYSCEDDVCGSFDPGTAEETDADDTDADDTDADDTGQSYPWCQREQLFTTELTANAKAVTISDTDCCWLSNEDQVQDWHAKVEMDLGKRSDTSSINNCPVTATVASIRVHQNCFTHLRLLAHDPDGDNVKCRLETDAPENFVLDEDKCSLSKSGTISEGVHVFEVRMEDFPVKSITLSYPDETTKDVDVSNEDLKPLCTVKVLFSIEVLPSLPRCEVGHVQPMFLSKTPSQAALIYASLGQPLTIDVQAQARRNTINNFQISGPRGMTKQFKDDTNGKAEATLSWTPQQQDVHRHVPVCFTAETDESQSEMRCVVIVVTKATITHGKADIFCKANQMTVNLEIASMPWLDVNYLTLLDKSCSLTSNSTHIIGTMTFSTCGTTVEDKGDYIAFYNAIQSFELPDAIITRRKKVNIGFSCQFPKYLSVSTYFSLHQDDYIFTESSFGSFGYTFEIYKDESFTEKVQPNEYPVELSFLEKMYMSIKATSDLQNVKMHVDWCKATPDDNENNPLSYDIIKDGCNKDETLKVLSSQDTTFNFEVTAFTFDEDNNQVYITCSVMLCEKDNPFSRCAQGCVDTPNQARRRRRRRRGLSRETRDHRITQGPFRFMGGYDDNHVQSERLGLVAKQDQTTTTPMVTKDQEEIKNQITETTPQPTSPVLLPEVYDLNDKKYKAVIADEYHHRGIRDVLGSYVTTIVFAAAFFVSIVVMVILVCHFTRKKRQEDMKMLLDSDEN